MAIAINIDGQIRSPENAFISVLDRGFLYGDSVYEVVRTYGGRVFALNDHLDRLARSADRLAIPLPARTSLVDRISETLSSGGNAESWCRLIVTRGVGPLTLDPTTAHTPSLIVIVKPFEPFAESTYSEGVRIWIPRVTRVSTVSVDPAIKSGNYLNSIMAVAEARSSGFDDALMLNAAGFVTEATTSNVFLVREGTVMTPPPDAGILAGVTRKHLMTLLEAEGWDVRERSLTVEDVVSADEVMLTSTVREVQPVVQVGDHPIAGGRPGPLAARFRQMFHYHAESSARGVSD